MSKSTQLRLTGLAAIIGSVIGIFVMPLLALAYFATADRAESLEPPWGAAWARVARPILAPLLTFGTPDEVYTLYGKLLLSMLVGFLAGLWGYIRCKPRVRAV